MSARSPHAFNPNLLPSMLRLLDLSRKEFAGEISNRGKQKKLHQRRPMPEDWRAGVIEGTEEKRKRGGQRSGIPTLPVARADAPTEEPNLPRLCALASCNLPLPPDLRPNRQYHDECRLRRKRERGLESWRKRDAERKAARPDWVRRKQRSD